jgi:hypothetical protein
MSAPSDTPAPAPVGQRSFPYRDALGVTVAAAAGLAFARFMADPAPDPTLGLPAEHAAWRIARAAWAIALPVTAMVAALWLVGPRQRRVAGPVPPGVAASFAALTASLVNFATAAHYLADPYLWSSPQIAKVWLAWLRDPRSPGAAVAAVWLVEAIDRRWRPEPTWIDRAGRGLGVFWLAAALALPVLRLLDR